MAYSCANHGLIINASQPPRVPIMGSSEPPHRPPRVPIMGEPHPWRRWGRRRAPASRQWRGRRPSEPRRKQAERAAPRRWA
eukprot:214618-Prymnesium_polylepis.1